LTPRRRAGSDEPVTVPRPPAAAAIVLAGGAGTRVGAGRNKVYLPLAGRSVLAWSLAALAGLAGIGPVVLVVRPADRHLARRVVVDELGRGDIDLVDGGSTRQESELCGLRHLAPAIGDGRVDTVLVHDGARPLLGPELAAEVLRTARAGGGAVPGLVRDDLARIAGGSGLGGPVREPVVAVQTPQGFRARPLLAAYESAARHGFAGTDTASCVTHFTDLAVRWIPGDGRNFKITYPHDLAVAEIVLARSESGVGRGR
jgi:2-C-methyl-D-erythritol 4-phosphate cytidylyltransferase